jgi:methionyl-tRNA synthetase
MPMRGIPVPADTALRGHIANLPGQVRAALDRQAFNEALEVMWVAIRAANAYIDQQAPWSLRKIDAKRMESVLALLVDLLRVVATLLQPFMPGSMARLLDQLAVPVELRDIAALAIAVPSGTRLPMPVGVFPRFVDGVGG